MELNFGSAQSNLNMSIHQLWTSQTAPTNDSKVFKSSNMATDLTAQVLDALSYSDRPILSTDAFPSIPSTEVKAALDRLKSREMVAYDTIDKDEAILTPEAEGVAANGSPEAKVFEAVRKAVEGLKISDLPVRWLNCMPARLDG